MKVRKVEEFDRWVYSSARWNFLRICAFRTKCVLLYSTWIKYPSNFKMCRLACKLVCLAELTYGTLVHNIISKWYLNSKKNTFDFSGRLLPLTILILVALPLAGIQRNIGILYGNSAAHGSRLKVHKLAGKCSENIAIYLFIYLFCQEPRALQCLVRPFLYNKNKNFSEIVNKSLLWKGY